MFDDGNRLYPLRPGPARRQGCSAPPGFLETLILPVAAAPAVGLAGAQPQALHVLVMEMVAAGMGVGILPVFLARIRKDLVALTGPLEDCHAELWLLTHPESRHLRRVSTVFRHLGEWIKL